MTKARLRHTRMLLDCLPDPVFIADARGALVLMNRPARALYRELSQRRRLVRALPEGVRALNCARADGAPPVAVYADAPGARFRFVPYTGGLFGPTSHVVVTIAEHGWALLDLSARYGLTARESEIARLMASHLSNPEIAQELGISPHTVRNHVRRVLEKLGVPSRRRVRHALNENGPK